MGAAIEAHQVAKRYEGEGRHVGLLGVDLDVGVGEVLAVLGHNGAGKTTLVRGLTTLTPFDSGRARVAGFDVSTQAKDVRARVGLVGQAAAVDEQLTAAKNLTLFGRLRGLGRGAARKRADELLDQFGLSEDSGRVVAKFSGGMRRRLDLAASLVVRPEVLFVDEPTTGLDPAARRDLWSALRALIADGTTVLLTTQYLEEADHLADQVVVLSEGRAVAAGTPRELTERVGDAAIWVRVDHPAHVPDALAALQHVDPQARANGPLTVTVPATHPEALVDCVRSLQSRGVAAAEVSLRRPTLEDVFLTLSPSLTQSPAASADPPCFGTEASRGSTRVAATSRAAPDLDDDLASTTERGGPQ